MVSWDDAQTIVKTLSSDSTSDSLTFFKLMMNVGYKLILAELGRPVTERTQTASTVADQQYYQLPPDFLFLKSVTVTIGSIPYVVQEEESQEMWNYLNARTTQTADIPERYFLRPGFGVSGAEVGIFPIPSSADNTITMVYEATDKDLATDKYTGGNVEVTNDSATVTGTGTTFTSAMVGRYFKLDSGDGQWYKVATFTSATVIVLENVYEGSSATGQAYQIAEIFNLPEELQILPCYHALAHYFGVKKDVNQETKYWTLFNGNLSLGKTRWGTKSRSNIVRAKAWSSRWAAWAPAFFPTNVT